MSILQPGGGPGSPVGTLHPDHQPRVPTAAGVPPYCTCGFVGGNGFDSPLLATHLEPYGHLRRSLHAAAYDARGRSVPEPIWRDMDQYADFNGDDQLAQARAWAEATFARDARVASVRVDEFEQVPDPKAVGHGWTFRRSVETITR